MYSFGDLKERSMIYGVLFPDLLYGVGHMANINGVTHSSQWLITKLFFGLLP